MVVKVASSKIDEHFSPGGSYEQNRGRQQTRLFAQAFCEHVRFDQSKEFSLLDVGCALGEAISVFSDLYPNANLSGTDRSKAAIEIAYKEKGHFELPPI